MKSAQRPSLSDLAKGAKGREENCCGSPAEGEGPHPSLFGSTRGTGKALISFFFDEWNGGANFFGKSFLRGVKKLKKRKMTTLRRFELDDLLKFNNVNLDSLTETYHIGFYLDYVSRWPEYFETAVSSNGDRIMGYCMGKSEGMNELWHGHVTAVTVAPEFRRQGLASSLMKSLERTSECIYNANFVDLFVRSSNNRAIDMYKK